MLEKVQVVTAGIIGLRVTSNSSRSCLYDRLCWEPLHHRKTQHKLHIMYM